MALTLSAASLVGLWLGFRSAPIERTGRGATPEPVDLQPRVAAVVRVGPHPADVAIGEGAVWVSVPAQEPEQDNLVVRVDSVTNEVVALIVVDGYIEEMAAGAGGVRLRIGTPGGDSGQPARPGGDFGPPRDSWRRPRRVGRSELTARNGRGAVLGRGSRSSGAAPAYRSCSVTAPSEPALP